MRKAEVYFNNKLAGYLTESNSQEYIFNYTDQWLSNDNLPAISLTFPKNKKIFESDHLFPFFFNMLSEGVNKKVQCRQLKIDEKDYFGLLLATAQYDTIGPVTVKPIETE